MLCVKAALHFHHCQVVDGDISEPQLPSVVQERPWERVGIQRVGNDPPFPVHTMQLLNTLQPPPCHAVPTGGVDLMSAQKEATGGARIADCKGTTALHTAAGHGARLVPHRSFFSSSRASSCSTNPSSPKHTRLKAPSCPSMLPGCARPGVLMHAHAGANCMR